MKNLLVLIFMLLSSFAIGQTKRAVSIIGSVDYNNRFLYGHDSLEKYIQVRDDNEIGKVGYRAGIDVNSFLSKHFELKLGLRFMSNGYNNKEIKNIVWESEYDSVGGGIILNPNLPHNIQYRFKYYFLEIPAAIRYKIIERKFTYYTEAGVSTMIYLDNRIHKKTDIDDDYSREVNATYKPLSFSFIASLGLQYSLNSKFDIFMQPTYRLGFTSLNSNSIKMNFYNVGCEFGIRRMY